jgi:selenocysteine lyase/cysteine desulfurase
MPLHTDVLGGDATTRMSFYVYNTKEDVNQGIGALKDIVRMLHK